MKDDVFNYDSSLLKADNFDFDFSKGNKIN